MSNNEKKTRFDFFVISEYADDFKEAIKYALKEIEPTAISVRQPSVRGEAVEMLALAGLIKIIVSLGGGIGIAAIIKQIARAIIDFQKAKHITVKYKDSQGRLVCFENCSIEQAVHLLSTAFKNEEKK